MFGLDVGVFELFFDFSGLFLQFVEIFCFIKHIFYVGYIPLFSIIKKAIAQEFEIVYTRRANYLRSDYMDSISLDVQTRDKSVKAKDLLKADLIPLEFYGKGIENQSFKVDYQTFRKVYKVAGSNTVIELNVDGKKKLNALVQDVQYDPIHDTFVHVDLVNVKANEEIHTHIPVNLTGMSVAVKDHSGILMHHLHEVEVKCLPKDLVHSIEVDMEPLVDFHSFIRVKDLVVPSGITILNDPEDVVVNVSAPRVEEESATVEAAPAAADIPSTKEEPAA